MRRGRAANRFHGRPTVCVRCLVPLPDGWSIEPKCEACRERDHWLEIRSITCSACTVTLQTLWRSPFYDDVLFRCSDCLRSMTVSLYDPRLREIERRFPRGAHGISSRLEEYKDRAHFRRIEAQLAVCECGGTFAHDAPLRCPRCRNPLAEHPGRVFGDLPVGLQLPEPRTENVWKNLDPSR